MKTAFCSPCAAICRAENRRAKRRRLHKKEIIMIALRKSLVRGVAVASLALLCAASARAQDKVQLRLNLQQGQTYDQVFAMQQKVSQTIQNRRTDVVSNMRFGIQSEVLEKKSDGTFKIKTTYRSAQMDNRITGVGDKEFVTHYDSTKPGNKVEPSTQVLEAMIGQSISSTVSPRGEVLKIDGWDKLTERIVDNMKVPAAQRAQMLKTMQGSLKSQTAQTIGLAIFPETPVAIGDSWTMQSSQITTLPILLATRYALAAVENGVATLNVQSKISFNPDFSVQEISDSKVKTDLSGAQNGVMRVDESSGLPRSYELHLRLAGRISVTNSKKPEANLSFPIYIKSTIRGWTIMPPR
jgi:hypothetical protein